MQQDKTLQLNAIEETASVTLLTVQREVGITRGTLKKYLSSLETRPICFHIGTCSLSIPREARAPVAQRKQKPALLAHRLNISVSQGRDAREEV